MSNFGGDTQPLNPAPKVDKNYRVHSLNNGIVTIEAQLSLEERQKRAKERIGSIGTDIL